MTRRHHRLPPLDPHGTKPGERASTNVTGVTGTSQGVQRAAPECDPVLRLDKAGADRLSSEDSQPSASVPEPALSTVDTLSPPMTDGDNLSTVDTRAVGLAQPGAGVDQVATFTPEQLATLPRDAPDPVGNVATCGAAAPGQADTTGSVRSPKTGGLTAYDATSSASACNQLDGDARDVEAVIVGDFAQASSSAWPDSGSDDGTRHKTSESQANINDLSIAMAECVSATAVAPALVAAPATEPAPAPSPAPTCGRCSLPVLPEALTTAEHGGRLWHRQCLIATRRAAELAADAAAGPVPWRRVPA